MATPETPLEDERRAVMSDARAYVLAGEPLPGASLHALLELPDPTDPTQGETLLDEVLEDLLSDPLHQDLTRKDDKTFRAAHGEDPAFPIQPDVARRREKLAELRKAWPWLSLTGVNLSATLNWGPEDTVPNQDPHAKFRAARSPIRWT